jgi:hypothetical protein
MKLAYAYHCLSPISGLEHALAEHERCVELWDDLVDIERRYEAACERAAAAYEPDVAAAANEIVELRARLAATPRKDRGPLVTALRDARRRVRQGIARWRRERKDEASRCEAERQAAVKAARQARAERLADDPAEVMYWCNSNAVLARYEAARAGARKLGRRLRHHDPNRDDGVLAVQIQRTRTGLGAAPEELSSLSMLRIDPIPDGVPRKKRYTTVTMRVDAAGHAVTLPMLMHRPLPAGRVKAAQLCWRRVGTRTRWQLVLQLADVPTEPAVAYRTDGWLDFCWELGDEGLIVARPSWREPYMLPLDWVRAGERLREQQSRLDQLLNEVRDAWEGNEAVSALLSGGQRAIYALRREQLPAELHEWLNGWRHLWYETDTGRRKWLRRRQWIYRQWAREIVRERSLLVIDDRRLDKIAREDRGSESNTLRQMACVHELRAELVHQARNIGATVVAGDLASGKILTDSGHDGSGVWQRRKAAKRERSQAAAESAVVQ